MQSNSSQRLKLIGQEAAGTRFYKVSSDYLLKMCFPLRTRVRSPAVKQIGPSIFRVFA